MNNLEYNLTKILEEKNIKILPENIKSGVTIFDVEGTLTTEGMMTQEDYDKCESIADEILSGTKNFIELEYIQGTGTQYIDTGYTPNHNTKVEITLSDVTASTGNSTIFGETWGNNRFLLTTYDNQFRYFYGTEFGISDITTKTTLSFYRRVITKDGTILNNDDAINNSVSFTNQLRIFDSTSGGNIVGFKLYRFKIYENNTIIKDYIPAKDDNNIICLYDSVSGTYTYASGYGTLVGGGII